MKLTLREQEIINILKKNPLMAQDELALILGITRSSAAVHISNLMKKGIIRGKGYVFNEQASIVILGECFLEININQDEQLDSIIDVNYRGVPVELSTVFSSYGIIPEIITFIGNDEVGKTFLDQLERLEVNTSNIYKHSHKRTNRKVYINKKLAFGENLTGEECQKAITAREWMILNCDWLILEEQFTQEIYNRTANKNQSELPNFCTYKVVDAIDDSFNYLSSYAIVVLGMKTMQQYERIISQLKDLLLNKEQVFVITDGLTEIIAVNQSESYSFPLLPNQKFSIHDKLSFFLAGLIYATINHHPLRQAIRIALGTTAFTGDPLSKNI